MNTGLENIGTGQAESGPNTYVYSNYLETKAMVAYLALVLRLWVTLIKTLHGGFIYHDVQLL